MKALYLIVLLPCIMLMGCKTSFNTYNNDGHKSGQWIEIDSLSYSIVNYKNGHLHGKQLSYSLDNDLRLITNYKNGKLHGKKITMFDGGIYGEAQYKNDSLIKSFHLTPTWKE